MLMAEHNVFWIGIEKDDDCIGLVARAGRLLPCGHFMYIRVSVNGKRVLAGGAEDRIYPFHSVQWEEIDYRQPKDMIPAIGWCKDKNTYAFFKPDDLYKGQIVRPGRNWLELVHPDIWKGGWHRKGEPVRFDRVDGRLLIDVRDHLQINSTSLKLDALQREIDKIGPNSRWSPLRVVGARFFYKDDHVRLIMAHIRRSHSDPTPYTITDRDLSEVAKRIVLERTKSVDWVHKLGACPVCKAGTKISPRVGSNKHELVGECGCIFSIRQWVE